MFKVILFAFIIAVNCQQQHQLRPRQQWFQACQSAVSTAPGWTDVRRGATACVSINIGQRHEPLDNDAAEIETNPNVHVSVAHSFQIAPFTNIILILTPNNQAAALPRITLPSARVINGAFTQGVTFAVASALLRGFTLDIGYETGNLPLLRIAFTEQNFGTTEKEIIRGPIVNTFANAYTDVKERSWDPTYVPTFTPLQDFLLLNYMGLDSQSWNRITAIVVRVSDAVTDIKEGDTVYVDFADCLSNLYEVDRDASAVYNSLTTSPYCFVRRGSIFGVHEGAPSRHIRQSNPFGVETPYGWF